MRKTDEVKGKSINKAVNETNVEITDKVSTQVTTDITDEIITMIVSQANKQLYIDKPVPEIKVTNWNPIFPLVWSEESETVLNILNLSVAFIMTMSNYQHVSIYI